MSAINGVVTGTVLDVNDPASEGRVLIAFPWLPGENTSYWAPVATLMSGGRRGSWFMPEPNDEVLVAFDHGNIDQPFVIGYLWNGAQTPPDDGGHAVRRVKTVSGHVLEFHDEDAGHKILIKTAAGQHIELNDTSHSVTIETSGGERVRLSPGRVLARTAGGQAIELDDAPPSATLKVPPGTITIDESGVTVTHPGSVNVTAGLNASVTAGAELTLSAPSVAIAADIAEFTGVVIAETLVAGAVVGAAYTPAPGNTFGL